jgi:CheY-like chemotaxis protein
MSDQAQSPNPEAEFSVNLADAIFETPYESHVSDASHESSSAEADLPRAEHGSMRDSAQAARDSENESAAFEEWQEIEFEPQDSASPSVANDHDTSESGSWESFGSARAKAATASSAASSQQTPQMQRERRRRRRAMISAPVRVRGVHTTRGGPDDVSITIDVSRVGILFLTRDASYYPGMDVAVTFPYSSAPGALQSEQSGRIVRIVELSGGRFAVAISLSAGAGQDLVDSNGKKLTENGAIEAAAASPETPCADDAPDASESKPIVLAVDADPSIRVTLKTFLESEGYKAMTVSSGADAREILNMFTPALIIAEVEGEGMPGYELCVHVKSSPRLKRIPVVLTTRSAYPSDYANAHSFGAMVCIAKPYKQERLAHVIRLLAPLASHKQAPAPAPRKLGSPSGPATAGRPAAAGRPDTARKLPATPHAGAGRSPMTQKIDDENFSQRPKLRFPTFR